MGIFSVRMNKEGAISGMIVGLLFTFVYIGYFKFIAPELNSPEHWLFGISPEGIGSIGAVLNFSVALLVSLAFPRPPQSVVDLVHHIRVPRGAATPQEH
jgi:cation/acetate symporter